MPIPWLSELDGTTPDPKFDSPPRRSVALTHWAKSLSCEEADVACKEGHSASRRESVFKYQASQKQFGSERYVFGEEEDLKLLSLRLGCPHVRRKGPRNHNLTKQSWELFRPFVLTRLYLLELAWSSKYDSGIGHPAMTRLKDYWVVRRTEKKKGLFRLNCQLQ